MSSNKLQQQRAATGLSGMKERGQYMLAFGIVASMLVVAGFPVFVIAFFGVFAFFLFKMFATTNNSGVREIFEFYLAANEILRDDDRKWFGFELRETAERGEAILQRMSGAPPLLHFTLGALYNKIGDHKSAVRHLSYVEENDSANELAFVYPTPELRSYVKVLRKIERDPADAPLTSSAVRSLERARKIRSHILLEQSRKEFATGEPKALVQETAAETEHGAERRDLLEVDHQGETAGHASENGSSKAFADMVASNSEARTDSRDPFTNRKSISEVLHDIYDTKRT